MDNENSIFNDDDEEEIVIGLDEISDENNNDLSIEITSEDDE